jgi:hypothetical protein
MSVTNTYFDILKLRVTSVQVLWQLDVVCLKKDKIFPELVKTSSPLAVTLESTDKYCPWQ